MSYEPYRFSRPDNLTPVAKPKLSVAVVIACRDGQEKLDLVLASLAAQSYPAALTSVYVIDDGSAKALVLPAIKPLKTKLISYKNSPGKWGKTAATNDCVARLREDVLWFIDADMVFDVRCLPNPHYDPLLRPLTGKDQPVADWLAGFDDVAQMATDIEAFIRKWLPRYTEDTRSYLTVAVGCTGGKHRSVYLVETLGKRFADHGPVLVRHRDQPTLSE